MDEVFDAGKFSVAGMLQDRVSIADHLPSSLWEAIGQGRRIPINAYLNAAIASLAGGQTLFFPAIAAPYCIDVSTPLNGGKLSTEPLPNGSHVLMEAGAWITIAPGQMGGVYFFSPTENNILQINVDGGEFPVRGGMTGRWAAAECWGTHGIGARNVVIVDSEFRNLTYGVRMLGADGCKIVRSRFQRIKRSGVLIQSDAGRPANNNLVSTNTFEDMGDTAVAFHPTDVGAVVSANAIHRNTAKNTQHLALGFAFDFEPGFSFGRISNNAIIDNTVEQSSISAYQQGGVTMNLYSQGGMIARNRLIGNFVEGSVGVNIPRNQDVTVIDNHIEGFRGGAVLADGSTRADIKRNAISNCGTGLAGSGLFSAVTVAWLEGCDDCAIASNDFLWTEDYAYAGVQGGAIMANGGDPRKPVVGLRIRDNTIRNPLGFGIGVRGYADAPNAIRDPVLEGNRMTGSHKGRTSSGNPIQMRYVVGGSIRNNQMSEARFGIDLTGSRGLSVQANTLRNAISRAPLPYWVDISGATRIELSNNRFDTPVLVKVRPIGQLTDPAHKNTARGNAGFTTENRGVSIELAPGGSIPHGLDAMPRFFAVAPSFGVGEVTVSANTTDLIVDFRNGERASFTWNAVV